MSVETGLRRVSGIVETGLTVADIGRAADFYARIFGFPVMFRDQWLAALNVAPGQALLLFLVGSSTAGVQVPGGYILGFDATGRSHFAFAIAAEALDAWRARLAAEKVAIESMVRWPRGAVSLYFRDPDGNLGELVIVPETFPKKKSFDIEQCFT